MHAQATNKVLTSLDNMPPGAAIITRRAVACALVSDIMNFFGEMRICVTGRSMLPFVRPGDILLVRKQELEQLIPGDIVLFAQNEQLLTHRVVGDDRWRETPFLVTRGDALVAKDPPVFAYQLLGRVAAIFRGRLRIDPRARRSWRCQLLAALLRHSDFLGRLAKWVLSRRLGLPKGAACQT
jgi:signal peptidase I